MTTKNNLEYIRPELLEDLGFTRKDHDDLSWDHLELLPINLILVDYGNGSWHFAQRVHAMNGIGRMIWLDDLIAGFRFVTGGKELIK